MRAARIAVGLVALACAGASSARAQQPDAVKTDTVVIASDSIVGRPDTSAASDTAKKGDVSAQDSPEDRGLLIRAADGSLQLRILGSIRIFGSYDFQGLPRADAFSPYEIPVPDAPGADRFYMDARQTRIGFETTWRKPKSSHVVFARIEADFAGTGNTFRLRHAYIRIDDNRFVLGQTWTAFTDIAAVPLTVDLDGPASSITLRSVQVRYTHALGEGLTLAGSIESPSVDLQTSGTSTEQTYQSIPDVIGQLRLVRPSLRAQAGAVFRVLAASVDGVADPQRVVGAGVMGSVLWNVSRSQSLSAQAVLGRGISRYVTGVAGRGLDLLLDPTDDAFVAPRARGAYVAYSVEPRAGMTVNAIVGGLWAPAEDFYPPSAYRNGGTAAVNVFLPLFPGTLVGIEGVYGWRTNRDGQSGSAFRLQARATYDF